MSLLPSHSLCAFRCWQTDRQPLFHSWIGGRQAVASPLLSCFPLSLYCLLLQAPSLNPGWFSLFLSLHVHSFILISQISLFCLPTHLLLVSPLCCSHFLSLISLSLPSPLPDSSQQCICHSHSPSLFISRLYVSVYPGLECHKQLGRSHSLLLHLLAWSPISLYRHCHLFYYIVPSLSVSCACSVRLCHHLHLSTNPSALITISTQSTQGTNVGWLHGEKHVQSSKQSLLRSGNLN